MRTTLTLDDDVAKLVKEEVHRTGDTFKGTINNLIRQGVTSSRQQPKQKRFVVTPLPLGLPAGLSYDNIGDLLEALEGPLHK